MTNLNKFTTFLLFFLINFVFAQETEKNELSLEKIFSSREFFPERLGKIQWFENGNSYTMLDYQFGRSQRIVKYDVITGDTTVVVGPDKLIPLNFDKPIQIADYTFSDDLKFLLIFTNTKRVWRSNTKGDYWILDLNNWGLKKLGGNAESSTLMFATISPDKKSVAFVMKNNLYVESLEDNKIIQLTFDGSETIINGTFDWVYEEELKLRNGFRWSPDSKRIAFWQLDASDIGIFNMINNTDSLYPKIIPVQYPKVGTKNSACKVGVVEINSQIIKWFDVPGDSRNNYIARMEWADSDKEVIIQQLNRLQNENRVFIGNAQSGDVVNIFTDKDDAWVEVVDDINWFDNGNYFTWLSEMNDWNHLYLISRNGKEIIDVTKGNFDVIELLGIDNQKSTVYFMASPYDASQRYLYKKSLYKDDMIRVTPTNIQGISSYNISPNYKYAIHNYSSIDKPFKTDLVTLPDHKVIRNLVSNEKLSAQLVKYNLSPIDFFKLDIGNNIILDGFKILPPNFDSTKKYPVIYYAYGEPAAQTVLDGWRGSNYLWHQMMAQKGYIIISVDNRGTPAPKGREWRKCVYGKVGVLTTADQADAVKTINKWNFIDENRIGVWGWSGGGSMTLNALFQYPELYNTGVSIAPVTYQKYYDTIYQERYMGTPETNDQGLIEGSPLTYAHQLQGNLLVIHGTADDNVHYQNTEALINELVKHNKLFSVMPYPNRSHGIFEGQNTTRHVYETMTSFFLKNLAPEGK